LRGGFVTPILLLDGGVAAISFGGADEDFSPEDRSLLGFVGNCAIGVLLHRRFGARGSFNDLSPRESDCLLWGAEGKTDWEIARILGISRSTVTKHILSAREKLGATTKGHAMVLAVRQKLIR